MGHTSAPHPEVPMGKTLNVIWLLIAPNGQW